MSFFGIGRPTLLWATLVLHLIIYYIGKVLFFHTRVAVCGEKRMRHFRGSAVFASNHASEMDTIVLCLALDKAGGLFRRLPLIILSREKEFYSVMGWIKATLYGGILFRLLGAYPVTPKKERATVALRQNRITTHLSLLKLGFSVFIFPEGTRTSTGKLLPAKPGVAILSEQANRPIIPVAIEGTFGLSFADFLSGKRHVRVVFGKPIFPMSQMTAVHLNFPDKNLLYQTKAQFVMHCIQRMLCV